MKTNLLEQHVTEGAKIVEFAGWDMPLHYGSQIQEHHAVRESAGRFDVSHMAVVDITGLDQTRFLRFLLAGDVARLTEDGGAMYTLMLNREGGIVDDLLVYRLENRYRLVVNAGTTSKDLSWIKSAVFAGGFDVEIVHRQDLSIVAVQGPKALSAVEIALGITDLKGIARFTCRLFDQTLVARTGYTGEDGVEVICPHEIALELWVKLRDQDVVAAGLAARDSLRLEAGLNLYGHDMDETTSPLVSNLAWTVHSQDEDRTFIGRSSFEIAKRIGPSHRLTGMVLEGRGVMREGYVVHTEAGSGIVTSGTFSPTLGISVGLVRIPKAAKGECQVQIRQRSVTARIQRPPFVKRT